jgi:hypothetical protein
MALYSTTKFMKDVPSTPQVMYQCLQKSVLRLTGSQITKVNFNTRYKIEWDNLDSEAFNALITFSIIHAASLFLLLRLRRINLWNISLLGLSMTSL